MMGLEIERKFLVDSLPELSECPRSAIVQAYLRADDQASVRVRIRDGSATLTIKGAQRGHARQEFEYPLPLDDAEALLELRVGELIEKDRYLLRHEGRTWELDVFRGANAGLRVAEIELEDEAEQPMLPEWVGREVSGDPRFLNANLCWHPYGSWGGDSQPSGDPA